MLVVAKASWHGRIYRWWYEHKYGVDWYDYDRDPNSQRSNLCPYMRAVMFWAPLRFLFWDWIKIGKVPLNVFTISFIVIGLPFALGYVSYTLKLAMWMIELTLIAIGLLIGTLSLVEYLIDKRRENRPPKKKKEASAFTTLVHEYLRSAHDRICPEVTIK